MVFQGFELKSNSEIEIMRRANRIVAIVLKELSGLARPGVTTAELDAYAEKRIRQMGARPSFKGYMGYPATICASINEQVVHGIPGKRALKDGDIISIDVGTELENYYGDAAVTIPVGTAAQDAVRLMDTTRQALENGIAEIGVGKHLSDISYAIQTTAEAAGFSVVREWVGHGIGRKMHEEPQIPNFGPRGQGPLLKAGMVLAIEPMLNVGRYKTRTLKDKWTVVTADGKLSCHFEHSVAVTDNGPDILSLP